MNRTRWVPVVVLVGSFSLFLAAGSSNAASHRESGFPLPIESITTDEADSLFAQAGRFYAQRRFREAIPLFQRVVELAPRHGNAYALLGGSYFQLGDYAQAIRAFEQALAVDEGIKLAYIGLVAANYLTRRMEDAQQWLVRLVPILNGEERDRYLATLSSQFPELTLPGS